MLGALDERPPHRGHRPAWRHAFALRRAAKWIEILVEQHPDVVAFPLHRTRQPNWGPDGPYWIVDQDRPLRGRRATVVRLPARPALEAERAA